MYIRGVTVGPWIRFLPHCRSPNPSTIFLNLEDFKRSLWPDNSGKVTSSLTPRSTFYIWIFRNKSSFSATASYRLESIFDQIDNELHRQTFKPVKKKNLIQLEFLALKYLRRNQDIIIKSADKASAIVIMDKQYYIDEGIRQLSNTYFYELPTDLSGECHT